MTNKQFAPVGWSVMAIYDDFDQCIGKFDYKNQAINYAKDANACWDGVNIMDRPVYSIKQNYPDSAYTN